MIHWIIRIKLNPRRETYIISIYHIQNPQDESTEMDAFVSISIILSLSLSFSGHSENLPWKINIAFELILWLSSGWLILGGPGTLRAPPPDSAHQTHSPPSLALKLWKLPSRKDMESPLNPVKTHCPLPALCSARIPSHLKKQRGRKRSRLRNPAQYHWIKSLDPCVCLSLLSPQAPQNP